MSEATDSNPTLQQVLASAAKRDERALLALTRRVAQQLEKQGAYAVKKDWSLLTRQATLDAAARWADTSSGTSPEKHVENVVRNHFWGAVLDLMTEGVAAAGDLFFPTVRRLLSHWDGSRRHEASWDDIAQETAHQLWERWRGGDVDRPWALLCTIAKRRYLDVVRATRPTDEINEESLGEVDADSTSGELFTNQALATLESAEREIIERMDLQGQTRVEVARELSVTEGQVLSIRRAGLRRIWRWLGRDLPPRVREVWEEMFKGSKRRSPDQVAQKLGSDVGEVMEHLAEARQLTGVG